MNPEFATQFAPEGMEARNAHDLDQMLEHYAEDLEMNSPFIRQIAGEASGKFACLMGRRHLGLIPELRFELLAVLVGVDSVVLHYRGVRLSAEVFHFEPEARWCGP